MADLTPQTLDIIFREASDIYQQALLDSPQIADQFTTDLPCSTRQVNFAFLDRVPVMRKWKGNRVINSVVAQNRQVLVEPFEGTISLSKWDVEDDNLGLFGNSVRMLADSAAKWKDVQVTEFLRNEAASTAIGYDGVPMFSAAHPIQGEYEGGLPSGTPATQSNLEVNTPLTIDNYIAMRAQMMAYKGADGQPLGFNDGTLKLMVPPQLEGIAKQILEADFIANWQGNANAPEANTYKGTATLIVNPYLSDKPDNWFLFAEGGGMQPIAWHLREAAQFTYLNNPSDPNVFMQAEFLYGVEGRAAVTETVWWLSLAATANGSY